MTTPPAENLNSDKIRQLLAAVGSESVEDERQNVEAFEYDWRRPRYFSRLQLNELKYFTENVSTAASAKFTRFYQSDFLVTTDSISQHFADEFLTPNPETENTDYYLAFGPARASADAGPSGLLAIPHQTALAWTTQSLGDNGSDKDSDRSLSQLEMSLLLDIASLFVEAFSHSYDNQSFNVMGGIVSGQFPLEIENTKELCKITFDTKRADAENADKAFLVMLCDKLEPVTKIINHAAATLSPEDTSKAIIAHLQKMTLSVTARLGSATITFSDMMNLGANDILILDTRAGHPIDLLVEELQFLKGLPAKSAGKYAVAITDNSFNNTN